MWLVYANTIYTIVYMHTCAGTIEIMNFLLTNQITAFQTAMIIRTSVSKQSSSMTILSGGGGVYIYRTSSARTCGQIESIRREFSVNPAFSGALMLIKTEHTLYRCRQHEREQRSETALLREIGREYHKHIHKATGCWYIL